MRAIKPDGQLTTLAELRERLASIQAQRERLCSQVPSPYHDVYEKHNAQIARLTEREGHIAGRIKQQLAV